MNQTYAMTDPQKKKMSALYAITGSKRDLVEKIFTDYGNFIQKMNESYELRFLVDDIKVGHDNEMLNKIKDVIKTKYEKQYNDLRIYGDAKTYILKFIQEVTV